MAAVIGVTPVGLACSAVSMIVEISFGVSLEVEACFLRL